MSPEAKALEVQIVSFQACHNGEDQDGAAWGRAPSTALQGGRVDHPRLRPGTLTRRNERDKFPDRNFVRPQERRREGVRVWRGTEGKKEGEERKHGDGTMEREGGVKVDRVEEGKNMATV